MPDQQDINDDIRPFLQPSHARKVSSECDDTVKALFAANEEIEKSAHAGSLWCHIPSWKIAERCTSAMRLLSHRGFKVWQVVTLPCRTTAQYPIGDGWIIAWGEVPEHIFDLAQSSNSTFFIQF
jgi:hypothetical protein